MNDLFQKLHRPTQPLSAEVPMTVADTEYSWTAPTGGVREVSFLLADDTVAWRFSAVTGDVVAGGSPRGAGLSAEYKGGLYKGTFYFASSTAAQTMRVEYVPVN